MAAPTRTSRNPSNGEFIGAMATVGLVQILQEINTYLTTINTMLSQTDTANKLLDTAAAQSASNKTLITPVIASFINAAHDHSNAAGGANIPANGLGTGAIYLGSSKRTTDTTTGSTSYVSAGVSVTVTCPTSRRIKLTASCGNLRNQAATFGSALSIWQGTVGSGTQLMEGSVQSAANDQGVPITVVTDIASPGGSITFNLGFRANGGGTAALSANAIYPCSLLVEAL